MTDEQKLRRDLIFLLIKSGRSSWEIQRDIIKYYNWILSKK